MAAGLYMAAASEGVSSSLCPSLQRGVSIQRPAASASNLAIIPPCNKQLASLSIAPISSAFWGRTQFPGRTNLTPPTRPPPTRPARQPAAPVALSERTISLAVAVATPFVLGAANALFNNPNTPFYRDLKKPSYNPPNWLFGLAWGILYPVMGLASWLVWSEGGFKRQAIPLTAYVVQLALNLLWPPIFFTAHNIKLALVDLGALVVAVAVTLVLFKPVNPLAAYLLIPYLAWVSFATFLNYNYLKLNGPTGDQPSTQAA